MAGTAVVIGAGIGGLGAAVALRRAGWQVTVHERAADLAGPGAALGIWPGALRALDRLGLGDEVRAVGVPQRDGVFRRPGGSVIGRLSTAGLRRRTGEDVRLLSRPALVRMLAGAAGPVRFGSTVAAAEVEADLVVAADGVFGRTRTALFGDAYRARYAGMTVWRGRVEGLPVDCLTETWGAGTKVGLTPQEDGATNFYVSTAAPQGTGPRDLRELVGTWHDPIPRLVELATDVLHHDLYVVPPLPTFVRGRTALIGDAAHAMTPDLGRGACEALTDAVVLASALAATPDVPTALARYDRTRRRTVQRLAAASLAANRLARVRRAVPLRDALLRLALAVPPAP